jgi:hypothetical protein
LAAVAALTAAILALLLPGVAEAQEEEQGAAAPATTTARSTVVVAPGDSLWSISQERLGPEAAPRQIALDVERIHQTNLTRMGADPNLVFPGQRLALPPPPPGAGAPAAAPEAPAEDRASAAPPEARRTATVAARGAPEQEEAAGPVPERAAEPIAPPALPEGGAVPEARELAPRAAPGWGLGLPDGLSARRLLGLGIIALTSGLGIIALTLLLAGIMAWRLPMRRDVGGDAEAWGLYPGYYHHHGEDRHDRQHADLLVGDKPRLATTTDPARRHEPAKRREPGRNGAKGSPRKGLAVAHNPSVRRALRRAPRGAPTPPGRPPRDRPVGARGPSRSAVVRRHPARRLAAGLARGRNR